MEGRFIFYIGDLILFLAMGISIKELMIDNIVSDEKLSTCLVKGINEKSIIVESKEGVQYIRKVEHLLPILITSQWLLRFGAEVSSLGCSLKGISIVETSSKDYWVQLPEGDKIIIPNLHSLQNLFALLGKPLIFISGG